MKRRLFSLPPALAVLAFAGFTPATASAHIRLLAPPSWITESPQGDPQKDAPCGGPGAPTGVVTQFRPGEKITVRWVDTVFHPGHFRIAFATDRSQLQDPMVTVNASQNAVSATIVDPPVAPVLADNLFPVTGDGQPGTMFQYDVTLPNITCETCTLQVIQFMEGHGPPNYIYHHCADIRLVADVTGNGGAGGMGGTGAGGATAGGSGGGGGTGAQGGSSASGGHGGANAGAGGAAGGAAVGGSATNGGGTVDGDPGAGASSSGCALRRPRGAPMRATGLAALAGLVVVVMKRRRRAAST